MVIQRQADPTSFNPPLVAGLHLAACDGSQADQALLIATLLAVENKLNASLVRRNGNLGIFNVISCLVFYV